MEMCNKESDSGKYMTYGTCLQAASAVTDPPIATVIGEDQYGHRTTLVLS